MPSPSTVSKPLVLHVSTVPESFGFLHGQIGFLRQAGFDVALVASDGPYAAIAQEREGIPIFVVEMERRITPVRDLLAVVGLIRLIRRLRPTIVHAHTPKGGLLGMLAATLARTPVRVYHLRGLPLETAVGMKRRLLTATEWLSCSLADSVVCVSASLREAALRSGVLSSARAVVLAHGSGNGVDWRGRFAPQEGDGRLRKSTRASLGIANDAMVLLFMGRVVADKGICEMTEAWCTLRDRFPSAELLVVGPEEATDPVPRIVLDRLKADRRVHMLGLIRDARPLFLASDVLVLPTYREGFPNVLLEAASLCLPVVATKVTGCVDAVLDGVTGYLVAPRDATALAEGIQRYLRDPALARSHGLAARERVIVEFDPTRIWSELEQLYRDLIARNDRLNDGGGPGILAHEH